MVDDGEMTGQMPRYVEDDEGGTMAVNPNAPTGDATALPFRTSSPEPNHRASQPAFPPRQSSHTVGLPVQPVYGPANALPWGAPPAPPPPAPPPMQPPPMPATSQAPQPSSRGPAFSSPSQAGSGGWGSGQASAFVPLPKPVAPPPMRRSEEELQRAAALGVGAVSNAAIPLEPAAPKPSPIVLGKSKAAEPAEEPKASARIDLLALDRSEMDRIKASKHLVEKKADDGLEDKWLSDEKPVETSLESKDRAAAHRALARATPMAHDELEATLGAALDASSGAYPVVLVAGELSIALDPQDALRALRGYASAWGTAQDKRLADAVDLVDAVLASPIVLPDALQIARVRLDEALRASNRPGLREVEPVIDRSLVEQRSFARRNVFGDRRVLAHFEATPGPHLPIYLSDTIARELPIMKRFQARLLVEVRPQQDASEAHPVALRALALGRVVTQSRSRR